MAAKKVSVACPLFHVILQRRSTSRKLYEVIGTIQRIVLEQRGNMQWSTTLFFGESSGVHSGDLSAPWQGLLQVFWSQQASRSTAHHDISKLEPLLQEGMGEWKTLLLFTKYPLIVDVLTVALVKRRFTVETASVSWTLTTALSSRIGKSSLLRRQVSPINKARQS